MSKQYRPIQQEPLSMEQKIANPCVRNCCLDDGNICMGCFRTLEEILAWRSLTVKQRKAVLADTERRRVVNAP